MVEPAGNSMSGGAAAKDWPGPAGSDMPPAPLPSDETTAARQAHSTLGAICMTAFAAGPIFLFVIIVAAAFEGGFVAYLDPMMVPALFLALIYSCVIGMCLAIVPVIVGTLLMVKLSKAVPAMAHPAAWGAGGFVLGAAILAALVGLAFPPGMMACLLVTSVLCGLLARRLVTLEGDR